MEKEKMYDLIREKLGEYVELTMPHDIFLNFSNQIRDGVPTQIVFKDELTGDMYAPEELVKMTYFYGIEDELMN